jgi:hypothetical protein
LLFPLYGYLWYAYHARSVINWRNFWYAHGIGLAVLTAWLYPLLRSAGGLSGFLSLYQTHDPMDPLTLPQNLYRFIAFNYTTGIVLTVVLVVILFSKRREEKGSAPVVCFSEDQVRVVKKVLVFWLVPPLLTFLFYAYSKGYILLVSGGIGCLVFTALRDCSYRRKVLITLAVLQSVYFIFTPYVSPDIDSYVAPRYRKKGLIPLWFDRIQSVYLMAQSQYRYLEKVDKLFSSISADIEEHAGDPFYDKKYVLIDPTCPVIVRSLQVKHPLIRFAALDLYNTARFFSYKGISFANETGSVRSLLQNALIFGRTDIITRFSLDSLVTKKEYGEYALYFYNDEAFLQGEVPHEVLFQRD